ncbi:MAG: hypothetical protein ACTTHG_04620 [Treponemataceae bacterium]
MKKVHIIFYAYILLCFILTGCYFEEKQTGNQPISLENQNIIQQSKMFIEEKKDTYVFETSSKRFKSKYGYTIWSFQSSEKQDFSALKVRTKKFYGSKDAGYGVVFSINGFCEDQKSATENSNNSMLCVMTRINGEYAVGSIENGMYKSIKPWTAHRSINTGFSFENLIQLETEGENYKLIFNGDIANAVFFTDPVSWAKPNSNYGYVVVIQPEENFPKTKVKVSFKKEI